MLLVNVTSVVAGLINTQNDPHILEGIMKVNGEEGKLPKRLVGVVWQDDLLLSNLTVEETIYFAARLKTPSKVSDASVKSLVESTMEELGLLRSIDLFQLLVKSKLGKKEASACGNVASLPM